MSRTHCELIPVLGSGWVGKSTCAAAIGLALAEKGARVAVITVDPARRLAQILGLKSLRNQTDRVYESGKGSLDALWLNQDGALTELVQKSSNVQARCLTIR